MFSATKLIVNVFEQCQSLLSPMHHYDFQLRTALATVNEAISLKNLKGEESEIVGRSIRRVLSPCIVNSGIIQEKEDFTPSFRQSHV